MLHLQISPHSGVPIFRQLMDQIKYYVASGALRPGSVLPSIRELARTLAVNPTTVVKAYTELEHEGVIEMKQGRGAFVAETPSTLSAEECAKALAGLAQQLVVEAKQMGAPKELVMRIVENEMDRMSATETPAAPQSRNDDAPGRDDAGGGDRIP